MLASAGKSLSQSLIVFIHIISHFMLYRFCLFFSDSGLHSNKACTAQVANGSDYKIRLFDMLSNTRLWSLPIYYLLIKLMATSDTIEGHLIITDIIPAIAKLCSQHNIKFTTMFSYHILLEHCDPLYITSTDIISSGKFFDRIAFK